MKVSILKQIRESLGLTQQQVADRMKVSQSDVSRIESRNNLILATLKKYIKACGGEVEVYVTTEKCKTRIDS